MRKLTTIAFCCATLCFCFAALPASADFIRPGTDSNDVIFGDAAANTIHARPGDDIIDGLGGNDKLYGDSGDDYIDGDYKERRDQFGVWGNDFIAGGKGNDDLDGNDGNDTMFGGPGRDIVNGDAGNDSLNGGPKKDVLNGGDGDDTINALGDNARDRVNCGPGYDKALVGHEDRFDPSCEKVETTPYY